jgi:Uma2 family endonuclease
MSTLLLDQGIEIPTIHTLEEFRRWSRSEGFPPRGRIDYVSGRIEIDMSPEDVFTHGTLKAEVATAIKRRVDELDLGHTFIAETRVSSAAADLSAEPDVMVISHQSLEQGRVRLVPKATGEPDRYVEVEGGPDLVVEIVSDSSEPKDLQRLPQAYFTRECASCGSSTRAARSCAVGFTTARPTRSPGSSRTHTATNRAASSRPAFGSNGAGTPADIGRAAFSLKPSDAPDRTHLTRALSKSTLLSPR